MMNNLSRTEMAAKNASWGMVTQIVNIVLSFIGRTIFIYLLNVDYLGVNGLFTNILTVLSFAELGIGNAIVFSLYKPIANNDVNKIQALMKLYAKAYSLVGIIIFIAGLCVIPFMGYIIKDPPGIKENLYLIYILFLLNTSLSYFFSYKKSLITAYQNDYLVQIYTRVFQIFALIVQSVFLLLTHEYLSYLIVFIFFTLLTNVLLSRKADQLYPYLREKNDNALSPDERKSIFSNVRALFIYKFGSVILNGTDGIIISSIINISAVGLSSNYTLLINRVTSVIAQAINSLTASVGNLSVNGSEERIKEVINQLLLLCIWLYGYIAIGFLILANDFIFIWLGKEYVLGQDVVFALVFSLYINGTQYAAYTFRTTQGLFVQSKYVPLAGAVINIVLSIIFGRIYGLAGIFIATGISRLITTTVVDPWLVYQNNFGIRPYEYYRKYVYGAIIVSINGMIQLKLIELIQYSGFFGFIIKFTILSISCNLMFLMVYGRTKEFKGLFDRLKSLVWRKV